MVFSNVNGPQKWSFHFAEKQRSVTKVIYVFLIIKTYLYFPWRYILKDLRDVSDFMRFTYSPPTQRFVEVLAKEVKFQV